MAYAKRPMARTGALKWFCTGCDVDPGKFYCTNNSAVRGNYDYKNAGSCGTALRARSAAGAKTGSTSIQ